MSNNENLNLNALDYLLDPETTKGPNPAAAKKSVSASEEAEAATFLLGSIKTYGFSILSNTVTLKK